MLKRSFIPLILSAFLIVSCTSSPGNQNKNTSSTEESNAHSQKGLKVHNFIGTYAGILPCKDCDSVKTEITLKEQGDYKMKEIKFGEKVDTVKNEGKWEFDKDASTITLHNIQAGYTEDSKSFLLANEALTPLGEDSKAVQAENGQNNVLTKQ